MTLTAPAHLCGRIDNPPGKPSALRDERTAWIVAQIQAGHSNAALAAALGVTDNTVARIARVARLEGLLPPLGRPVAAPHRAKRSLTAAEGKMIMSFPGSSGELSANRVSLPCIIGEECEARPDPRPESYQRFAVIGARQHDRKTRDVSAVIAAIRNEVEAQGAQL